MFKNVKDTIPFQVLEQTTVVNGQGAKFCLNYFKPCFEQKILNHEESHTTSFLHLKSETLMHMNQFLLGFVTCLY